MLLLNNADVQKVLTMAMTVEALEDSYRQLVAGTAVCRPRIDIRIPTGEGDRLYQWGTMEGGSSVTGYFATRIKSDITYEDEYNGVRTHEKYCLRPGLFCGLILVTNIRTGEPVALMNDGYLQHMRVGADGGIGVKYMAREDARVLGMLGSGGMARTHAESFSLVRKLERIKVYSPTKEHREAYARDVSQQLGIEVVPVDHPREVHQGVDIVASCTDSNQDVVIGEWLEEGVHVTNVGGRLDRRALERIDVSLRLGSAPAPVGLPEWRVHDEGIAYEALPPEGAPVAPRRRGGRAHGVIAEDRAVFFEELLAGTKPGRRSAKDITYSERGNIQGAQFYAVAGRVYEAAKKAGLGHELPAEWFLQDIRD